MFKKIFLLVTLLFSLCSCHNVNIKFDLLDSINQFEEYYNSQKYNVIEIKTSVSTDNGEINQISSNEYYKLSDNTHLQYIDNQNFYVNYRYPTVIKLEQEKYYMYNIDDLTYLKSKNEVTEEYFNGICDFSVPNPGSFLKYFKLINGVYKADIKYSLLSLSNKRSIKNILGLSKEDSKYVKIDNIVIKYNFDNNRLNFDFIIHFNIKDYKEAKIGGSCTISYLLHCDEFELANYDNYVLKGEENLNKTIDGAKIIDDIKDEFYIASGDNYYYVTLKQGLYTITEGNYEPIQYYNGINITLFDNKKQKIPSYFSETLIKNTRWANYLYVPENGDYYINFSNSHYPKMMKIVCKNDIQLPTNQEFTFETGQFILNSMLDYRRFTIICDENTFISIKNKSYDASITAYYDDFEYPLSTGNSYAVVFEKGTHELLIYYSGGHDYPIEIELEITQEKIENPDYAYYSYNFNELPVLSEEFSEKVCYLTFSEKSNERYFTYSCNETGNYYIESEQLVDNWKYSLDVFYSILGEKNISESYNGSYYLEAGKQYIFKFIYYGDNLYRFKITKSNE